ncbi:MAG: sigma-70 family RNA polymerase sigma factor [Chitinophagaceae bacterium]
MNEGVTDTEIINRVLGGETAAYAELVTRYQHFVFTLALRFTHHREDAEEVAQDIFIKAYRALSDFRGAAKFSTWLYTIVYTTSITFLRKKRMVTTSIDDDNIFLELESKDSGLKANQVEQKSRTASLAKAIGMLSADDAQIITLFYKAEQSLEEIGLIMGLEPNSVKVRLHRARQRLKEKIEKYMKHEISSIYDD